MINEFLASLLRKPKYKYRLKRIDLVLQKSLPLYDSFSYMLRQYIRDNIFVPQGESLLKDSACRNIWEVKNNTDKYRPLVSIVVPNYNHELYLEERLESIYRQTYTNYEVILLDDCSVDSSTTILEFYLNKFPHNTTLYKNKIGSGSPFKQWQKGISLAKGALIWIAESDDYCDSNFLEEMIKNFSDESVMLAFSRSMFMKDGRCINTTDEYLQDISGINWQKPFCMAGSEIVKKGFALKNIIPNASSAVFRNIGTFSADIVKLWETLQLSGDWVFYLSIIKGGVLAYTNKTTNYYRVHNESTSLKIQKQPEYYIEFQEVAKYTVQNYIVDMKIFEQQRENLRNHYLFVHPNNDGSDIDAWYDIAKIAKERSKRLPNVIMCGFSFAMGGGEIYPIILANALKKMGIAVTYFDFNMDEYNPVVRGMLSKDIPLVNVPSLVNISNAINDLSAEIIHSHHASVDEFVSLILQKKEVNNPKQIITLHGMYEAIDKRYADNTINNIIKTCNQFIYIADKNLDAFKLRNDVNFNRFTYLKNGMERAVLNPVDRKLLGISDAAFVICIASRAIPEKGWQEACQAVKYAREKTNIDIQLLLIGKGEVYDRYMKEDLSLEYVHLLGEHANVQDYFACSDIGMVPSRFKGESYPLVIIECLFAGKPIIASNIGEIKKQLSVEDAIAGMVFDLDEWKIPIDILGNIIIDFAQKGDVYFNALSNVNLVSKKFDMGKIARKHLDIYIKAINSEDSSLNGDDVN